MAVTGGAHWSRGYGGISPNRNATDASSEAIFAAFTREYDVPRRLRQVVARFPSERPLLVLQPHANPQTSLPSMMIAYELCDRTVVLREAALTDSPAAVEELRKIFAAVIFVGQKPPSAFPPAQYFGQMMALVPLTVTER